MALQNTLHWILSEISLHRGTVKKRA